LARKIFISTFLFFIYLQCFGQNTDVELWLSAEIRKDLGKKFRLYYEQGYRRDDFLAHTKTFYFETGGFYKPAKFLWIGPYYRFYSDFRDYRNNHLVGVLVLRGNLNRFDLKSRSRYIAEFGRDKGTDHYLRERISLDYDIRNFKIDPFIASEFIFHLQPEKTENEQIRLETGAEWKLAKRHTLDFFYRYQIERNVNDPIRSHVIGIDYCFEF
jgi:hypothetical protein